MTLPRALPSSQHYRVQTTRVAINAIVLIPSTAAGGPHAPPGCFVPICSLRIHIGIFASLVRSLIGLRCAPTSLPPRAREAHSHTHHTRSLCDAIVAVKGKCSAFRDAD